MAAESFNRKRHGKKVKELMGAEALLTKLFHKLGYNPENYAVFEMWDRLLGQEAQKARAVGLSGARLVVEVDSSARMHDLLLRKRSLLKKLNEHFGTRRPISDIIVKLVTDRRSRSAS